LLGQDPYETFNVKINKRETVIKLRKTIKDKLYHGFVYLRLIG